MKRNNVHGVIEDGYFRLYINNLLHCTFAMSSYVGLQSYIDTKWYRKDWYIVEMHLEKDVIILLEYDKKVLWEHVLEVLQMLGGK